MIKELDIRVAPYHLIMQGKDYRDQIDITPAEFWKVFKGLKELPTTAAVSPGDYADIFKELAKSTDSIACIIISRALSAAYKSAEEARDIVLEKHPNLKIELIDTRNSVGALGFIVLEAARAAKAGKTLEEVVKVTYDLIPRVKYVAAFDTLKYLIKGGRAPKTAVIGDFLQIKPIIGIIDHTGMVQSLGKERGKNNAISKLADLIKSHADMEKPLHVMAHFTDRKEDAEALRKLITSQYNCAEVYMTDLTPVMATHTGPAVGLSFYS